LSRQDRRLVAIILSLLLTLILLNEGQSGWAAFSAFMCGMWASTFLRRVAESVGFDPKDDRS
jgi:hypothetical protein